MICTLNQATNRYELRDLNKTNYRNDPDSNEIDGYDASALPYCHTRFEFWHELTTDEQQRVFKQVKNFTGNCVFQGRLMTMPLLDIELDKNQSILLMMRKFTNLSRRMRRF